MSSLVLPRVRLGLSGAFARSFCSVSLPLRGAIKPPFGQRSSTPVLFHAVLYWKQQRSSFCSASSTITEDESAENEDAEDEGDDIEEEEEEYEDDEILNFGLPLLKVAVLGPPNAGKSTLYNRLLDKRLNKAYRLNSEKHKKTGKHLKDHRRFGSPQSKKNYAAGTAIVSDVAGTTRDRREGTGRIGQIYFHMIDTAGVDGERLDSFFKTAKTLEAEEQEAHAQQNKQKKETHKQRRRKEKEILEQTRNSKKLKILRNLPSVLEPNHVTPKEILRPMMQHALAAAREAHLILVMFDARLGLTSDFYETCKWLRRYASRALRKEDQIDGDEEPQRIMIVANKLEGEHWDFDGSHVWENMDQAGKVGFGQPIMISALHGDNISEIAGVIHEMQQQLNSRYEDEPILDSEGDGKEIFQVFQAGIKTKKKPRPPMPDLKAKPLQLAILGRVNVGKSTLVNSLLKQDRVITGATPGLTRDAISIPWSFQGRPVQLVDTAGLRKPTKRKDGVIEDMAVLDAMRAMKIADVAVLVLDAGALFLTRHELAICQTVLREGRSLVIAANKMDLIVNREYTPMDFAKGVREQLETRYPMLRQTPIVAMSSLNGKNVDKLMPVVFDARDRWERKIPTGHLNRWLKEVLDEHRPPAVRGKHTKIKFMAQTKGRPPTFLLFANHTEIPDNYLRYLTRQFQESFDFFGMEVRFVVKHSINPFVARLPARRRKGFGVGGRDMQNRRMWQRLKETGSPSKVHKKKRRWRM